MGRSDTDAGKLDQAYLKLDPAATGDASVQRRGSVQ